MPESETEEEEKELSLAEQEVINYCEANGFEHEEEDMNDEDKSDFIKIKKRFIKTIDDGRLVVDGENLIYTVSERSSSMAGKKITIRRPIGKDFLSMDGFKETQSMVKFQSFLASFCDIKGSDIARLDLLDRKFLQDIGALFLDL
jgi:tRNA(Ile)-lysidine synthase TilS/MesJ